MKLYKIFAVALAAITLTACSDDDSDYNTAKDVTVSMANATQVVNEVGGIQRIPLVINGVTNGPVKVTVKCYEEGQEPAMEDVHFIVTSASTIIPKGQTEGYIEFYPVNDDEINDPRKFRVEIVSAEGASIANPSSTIVTIEDDDNDPYLRMLGKWSLTAVNVSTGAVFNWNITFSGANPGEPGYEEEIVMTGWQGYDWVEIYALYSYDKATDTVTLSIPDEQTIATGVDFGLGAPDDVDLWLLGVNGATPPAILDITCNDYANIDFSLDVAFGFIVIHDGSPYAYWTRFVPVSLNR